MNSLFRKKSTIFTFLGPALLLYSLVVFVPIIWSVYHSFYRWSGLGTKEYIGVKNFIQLFTADRNFWPVFSQTFIYTGLQITFQVGGGLALAILLVNIQKGRSILQAIFYIPVIISSVAICQIFGKLLSVSPVGIVNELLGFINSDFRQIQWLTTPKLSLLMCAMVEGYKTMGIYMVIFYSALISVPHELVEAAIIDGTTSFQCLIHIKIPYIQHIILANTVLVLNNSFRSFDIPFLLTSGGPGTTSELLASFMYKKSFSSMQYGYGSSIATVIVLICFSLAVLYMKVFTSEENSW